MDGPQISTSMIPVCAQVNQIKFERQAGDEHTWVCSSAANAHPSWAVNVLLPTPPLPLRTRTLRLISAMRARMWGSAGSGPVVTPAAHTSWLAQPLHASALPACSDSVPCKDVKITQNATKKGLLDNALVHWQGSTVALGAQQDVAQRSLCVGGKMSAAKGAR